MLKLLGPHNCRNASAELGNAKYNIMSSTTYIVTMLWNKVALIIRCDDSMIIQNRFSNAACTAEMEW